MIKDTRKNITVGGSKGITYPYVIAVGKSSTLAGNRLLLVDPQGKIPPEVLLKFHEQRVEPYIQELLKEAKRAVQLLTEGRLGGPTQLRPPTKTLEANSYG